MASIKTHGQYLYATSVYLVLVHALRFIQLLHLIEVSIISEQGIKNCEKLPTYSALNTSVSYVI